MGGGGEVAIRLTLGEGETPLEPSASEANLLLKREDANPTGSHKDRAAAFQLAHAAAEGCRAVVISSSGNAGIATSRYAELHDITAIVCVHPDTDPHKLAAIDGSTTILIITPRAINTAKAIARTLSIPNLRPSVSDDAIAGFRTLGEELANAHVDDVVLFATSGASAIAVAEVLHERAPGVAVHFVQGEGNAGLAAPEADITLTSARSAAAGRLGVRRSRRAARLTRAITATGGRGHVVSAAEVSDARAAFAAEGIEASDESSANRVVALRLVAEGHRVVSIVSGIVARRTGSGPHLRFEAADEDAALARLAQEGLVAL